MKYDPPLNVEQIKRIYRKEIIKRLLICPIHKWRAERGIELVHKEPTLAEQKRTWKNWQLMPDELKEISDKKSLELFGKTNKEHYNEIISQHWGL